MFAKGPLKYFFIIAGIMAIIYPLVNIYFIFPLFGKIIAKNTEDESVRVARNLAAIVVSENKELKDPSDFAAMINKTRTEFGIEKIKVFSKWGEVIYSTDPSDTGKINREQYFKNIVAAGNIKTEVIERKKKTLEGRLVTADVVETYVPIMSYGEFLGAFEIYYDITQRNNTLYSAIYRSTFISFAMMFAFFVAIIVVFFKSDVKTPDSNISELSMPYKSPLFFVLMIGISIFVVEAIVMFFLSAFPPISKLSEAIVDASLLLMMVSPVLYFFLLRPLLLHITERKRIEDELKRAHETLELRVNERTSELSDAYNQLKDDMAERRKLEDQLLHAQKLEAIGTLAGGIAHEFNNILTAITGYNELLQEEIKKDTHLKPYAEAIAASSNRAAELTKGLLLYSKKQEIDLRPTRLNHTVNNVRQILSKTIGEDIELKIMLSDKEHIVIADSGQLEQVLMNLATNARDAMSNGGTLTIETGTTELNREFIAKHGYGTAGKFAFLSVSDTGVGIDDYTKQKLFEPFYTTKDVGKGTGLGLSVVYGIIKQHNGYIDVLSDPGKETRFTIYLPEVKLEESADTESLSAPFYSSGTETILIAEDDSKVRELVTSVLEKAGYKIIEAIDGSDAIEKFRIHQDKIRFLLLDVMLPKKKGIEVYDEIIKINSDIKALFISGYSRDVLQKMGIYENKHNFIPKPFSQSQLLKKIRDSLDN
jgi:signal transduction histidine kinase/CheY-like chemotaxis protein